MLTLRKKIFLSYGALFCLFVALMIPLATKAVQVIIHQTMNEKVDELIFHIQTAPNDEELIRYLKDQKKRMYFRVSIINFEKKVLYDTHTKRLLGPKFSQDFVVAHPEVLEAFEKGKGYHEAYSRILDIDFIYFAKAFDFHGKKYVLRAAFPHQYLNEVMRKFEIGFLMFAGMILLFFSLITWIVIYRLMRPINHIIDVITPYQEGKEALLPKIELQGVHPDDEFFRLANTLNLLSSKIDQHIHFITVEKNEKSTILDALTEGILLLDREGVIIYANPKSCTFLKRKELKGLKLEAIQLEEYHTFIQECVKEGKTSVRSFRVQGQKNIRHLDVIGVPLQEGKGSLLVLQDKTEHHQLIERQKEFIANASHELKTPITIIRGFSEMLYEHTDMTKDKIKEVTEKMVRNCERMQRVIQDLLILSDLDNIPKQRLAHFDIVALLNHLKGRLEEAYSGASLVIHAPALLEMEADPELLELAFFNLIENGAKYSESPAKLFISVAELPSMIEIKISDQGIGIAQKDLPHIFQRFYTVDKARSRKMGGSGLGLSIVHTIIKKHQGSIQVESTLGVGTTFTVQLPKVYSI